MSTVTLREVTRETLRAVLNLTVDESQEEFVAPNAVSIAEAHFSDQAWFRAVYADEEPVGFVMLALQPEKPRYYLWRFMIDHRHQGRGYGMKALNQVIEFVKTQPHAQELELSYVAGDGSPRDFYASAGFVDTGVERNGEWMMQLDLAQGT